MHLLGVNRLAFLAGLLVYPSDFVLVTLPSRKYSAAALFTLPPWSSLARAFQFE
jgi:hypothetical protein